MESRMVKFYSKESNMVAIHAIPGHFATSHSHINYYIDITSLKTRIQEAKEVARVLHQKIGRVSYVDTIVCMDGTEVIGAFLAEEFEKEDMASTNRHETIYVVSPEMNSNNQLLFRDNTNQVRRKTCNLIICIYQQPERQSTEVLRESVTMAA